MTPAETVASFVEALDAGDLDRAAAYLSDDFVLDGLTPRPLDKPQFLAFVDSVRRAFPDWSFHPTGLQEQGSTVMLTLRGTGTHTGDLRSPVPGLPEVPASGRTVSLPDQPARVTVRGDQVASITVQPVAGGGILGILQQLGIQLPTRTV
ncbi:MAG: ester cyclase [Sphingomonadaceae bacterium]